MFEQLLAGEYVKFANISFNESVQFNFCRAFHMRSLLLIEDLWDFFSIHIFAVYKKNIQILVHN